MGEEMWGLDAHASLSVYLCNKVKFCSPLKEGNPVICDDSDEPGKHYAKWNKPQKDKCYMASLICGV